MNYHECECTPLYIKYWLRECILADGNAPLYNQVLATGMITHGCECTPLYIKNWLYTLMNTYGCVCTPLYIKYWLREWLIRIIISRKNSFKHFFRITMLLVIKLSEYDIFYFYRKSCHRIHYRFFPVFG